MAYSEIGHPSINAVKPIPPKPGGSPNLARGKCRAGGPNAAPGFRCCAVLGLRYRTTPRLQCYSPPPDVRRRLVFVVAPTLVCNATHHRRILVVAQSFRTRAIQQRIRWAKAHR